MAFRTPDAFPPIQFACLKFEESQMMGEESPSFETAYTQNIGDHIRGFCFKDPYV